MAASIRELRPQAAQSAFVEPKSRSIIAAIIGGLVALCGLVPYALVALGLRLVIARVFFLAGQGKITGPIIPISLNIPNIPAIDFSVVLPTRMRSRLLLYLSRAGMPWRCG